MPSNKTMVIQAVGRALRLFVNKKNAHVIIPFSTKDDESSITEFLRIIGNNDRNVKRSLVNKTIGGYISLEKIEEIDECDNDDDNEFEADDDENANETIVELRYNLVFDSLGRCLNSTDVFKKKLDELKKFMEDNKRRPSSNSKDPAEKKLGFWINHTTNNYKNEQYSMSLENEKNRSVWDEFVNDPKWKEHFMSDEEFWLYTFEQVKSFMEDKKRRPWSQSKDPAEKKLGCWVSNTIQNYKNEKQSMSLKNKTNRSTWKNFINDPRWKEHLMSGEEFWLYTLEQVKSFMEENNKRRPSSNSKDPTEKKLGLWVQVTTQNYKNEQYSMSLENEKNRSVWDEFVNDPKWKEHFMSNEEFWLYTFGQVRFFMEDKKRRPYSNSKDLTEKKLGSWVVFTIQNYKNEKHSMSLKNEKNRSVWENFITDPRWKENFMSDEEVWFYTFEKVKSFMEDNIKRPSSHSKDPVEKKLGKWVVDTTINYKNNKNSMSLKNKTSRSVWEKFITDPRWVDKFRQ